MVFYVTGSFSNDNSYDFFYMYCHPNLLGQSKPNKEPSVGMNVKFERSIMVDKLTLTKPSDGIVEVPTPDQDPIGILQGPGVLIRRGPNFYQVGLEFGQSWNQ
jgi:hypothetical protein